MRKTMREYTNEVAAELISSRRALEAGKLTPAEWEMKQQQIYADVKRSGYNALNVWRAAAKHYELVCFGGVLP